ncbi:MAG: AMP-binding protein [Pirellulales bacterium]|nr:AMP-binding protein [Pirellulales bacterium]
MPVRTNVADRLTAFAAQMPDATALVSACGGRYRTCTFRELDIDATALARGLVDSGAKPGDRLVLLVRPGIEFVKLVFALLRSGATTVLIDPGMGRRHLVDCLAATNPDGFIAVSPAQAVRTLRRRRFGNSRLNVTVGRRWFWGGVTYRQLLGAGHASRAGLPATSADDAAAIIFTSGSTGPPKGVLYTHRMFDTQAGEIERAYQLGPGGADLACFALFGLFNSAMGVTTVFPEMDFSRPASADPRKLLAAANDCRVTQAFASPAVWDKLSRRCQRTGERIPTLRKVFSCGAPVPAGVLERTLAMVHPDAEMHTPYGATEALPIATIEAREVLGETAAKTSQGAGVCVGRKFDTIEWRVIRISDEPIATMEDAEELPAGEIGELIVRGPQVSASYLAACSALRGGLTRGLKRVQAGFPNAERGGAYPGPHPSPTLPIEGRGPEELNGANAHAKIRDGGGVWHRMGDVGYFDDLERFWYCGRKSHRVESSEGALFTEKVEAIFNQHALVHRTALVGIGKRPQQEPILIFEPAGADATVFEDCEDLQGRPIDRDAALRAVAAELEAQARNFGLAGKIRRYLRHGGLPVDVRHNSKINREALAAWAEREMQSTRRLD